MQGADAYAHGLGDRIYYVQYYDEQMNPIKTAMKDDDGNVVMPDMPDGKFKKVNETWYNANIQALKEFEKRVDDEMEERVLSDSLNATVMGLSPQQYNDILKPKGGLQGMSPEMVAIDGRVVTIRSTPPGIEQTRMLSKLRFLVSKRLTNIKRNKVNASTTSKNTVKENVTNVELSRDVEVKAQLAEAKGEAPPALPLASIE